MDNHSEVREFLMSHRAKIAPEQVGLFAGANRRVAGLRRTEVATLAGLSVEYYAKIERGAIGGASASVLDAIARALNLDDTEQTHLFDLARLADGVPLSGRPRRRATQACHEEHREPAQSPLGTQHDHRRRRIRARPPDPGFVLMIYTAEPGSPSAERLRLLARWAATQIEAVEPV